MRTRRVAPGEAEAVADLDGAVVEPAQVGAGELVRVRVVVEGERRTGLDDVDVLLEQTVLGVGRQQLEQRLGEQLVATHPVGGQRRLVGVAVGEVDDAPAVVANRHQVDPGVDQGVDDAAHLLARRRCLLARLLPLGDVDDLHDVGEDRVVGIPQGVDGEVAEERAAVGPHEALEDPVGVRLATCDALAALDVRTDVVRVHQSMQRDLDEPVGGVPEQLAGRGVHGEDAPVEPDEAGGHGGLAHGQPEQVGHGRGHEAVLAHVDGRRIAVDHVPTPSRSPPTSHATCGVAASGRLSAAGRACPG